MKSTEKLASMAEAAAIGGAVALRIDGADMVRELKKRNVDKKQIDQVRKTWKKVKAEPVVGPQNQKKK